MNIEYTYVNGKVIVIDENNNKRVTDYHDNIDQVLVSENVIEEIDNKISEYKRKLKSSVENEVSPAAICGLVGASLVIPSLAVCAAAALNIMDPGDIEKLVFAAKVSTGVNSSIFSIMGLIKYHDYLKEKKYQNGLKLSIDYLESRKEGEMVNLKRLNSTSINSKLVLREDTKKVNDIFQKRKVNSECNFYYKLGYNAKEYLKYLKKGILESKLADEYDESHAKEAFMYVDNNQFTLAKKYR